MKEVIFIKGITPFVYRNGFKTRTEIEYYSDGTSAIAEAIYERRQF